MFTRKASFIATSNRATFCSIVRKNPSWPISVWRCVMKRWRRRGPGWGRRRGCATRLQRRSCATAGVRRRPSLPRRSREARWRRRSSSLPLSFRAEHLPSWRPHTHLEFSAADEERSGAGGAGRPTWRPSRSPGPVQQLSPRALGRRSGLSRRTLQTPSPGKTSSFNAVNPITGSWLSY